jgi:8-oxo-dGTP diphosphatase
MKTAYHISPRWKIVGGGADSRSLSGRPCKQPAPEAADERQKAMPLPSWPTIRIAAGLIVDRAGRVLLVRKRGMRTFMQAGGKIERHEGPAQALARELEEELGIRIAPGAPEYLGEFTAQAANETRHIVHAACFYIRADLFSGDWTVSPAAEIEEAVWIAPSDTSLPLAPLTRDHLLPIARGRLGA